MAWEFGLMIAKASFPLTLANFEGDHDCIPNWDAARIESPEWAVIIGGCFFHRVAFLLA